MSGFLGIGFAKFVCSESVWKRSMTSIDVLNIHNSNARLSVSNKWTRLGISIRCGVHELSYINATSAKLVCMHVCMYVCMYVICVCMCVCLCICHVCMYVKYVGISACK